MKKTISLLLLVVFLIFSCSTKPETVETVPENTFTWDSSVIEIIETNFSKQENYEKIKSFLDMNFTHQRDLLTVDDFESGVIKMRNLGTLREWGFSNSYYFLTQIDFKENKIMITLKYQNGLAPHSAAKQKIVGEYFYLVIDELTTYMNGSDDW